MSTPATPELDLVEAQYARLQAVSIAAGYHTELGARIALAEPASYQPELNAWWAGVETESEGGGVGHCRITWQAVVPLSEGERDAREALRVVADMRAALIDRCAMGETQEATSGIEMRPEGASYAAATITTQTTIILEGQFDG